MCACPPGDCPDVWTTATDNGKTVVMEVGQWISLELPGAITDVTASSSEPSVLKVVGKQRLVNGNEVYTSFKALKAGAAQLTSGYKSCGALSAVPCSYQVSVHVVKFPEVKVTVSSNASPPPIVPLHVGESARFSACCLNSLDELPVTVDRPDVLEFAVEPYISFHGEIEGAVTAVSPGTAHVQGQYCPPTVGSYCPSAWSLTVIVT